MVHVDPSERRQLLNPESAMSHIPIHLRTKTKESKFCTMLDLSNGIKQEHKTSFNTKLFDKKTLQYVSLEDI